MQESVLYICMQNRGYDKVLEILRLEIPCFYNHADLLRHTDRLHARHSMYFYSCLGTKYTFNFLLNVSSDRVFYACLGEFQVTVSSFCP